MSDFDNPWKEALEMFLELFLRFFFPDIHALIDWSRPYDSLDTELQQIVREGELGPRLADKLFRVWLKNGKQVSLLIHIEVQNQLDPNFDKRMYTYNYRIYDRCGQPVISLAVLGDESPDWQPGHFAFALGGFSLQMDFPTAKLLDYAKDLDALESHPNPFAVIVLAHLQTQATRNQPEERYRWKMRLFKRLFDRGLSAKEIRQLLRLIDWLMDLPPELEEQFSDELYRFEEERRMPYVTSMERVAMARGRAEGKQEGRQEGWREGEQKGEVRGLREGIELALELKFGAAGLSLMPLVQEMEQLEDLRAFRQRLRTAASVDELRAGLAPVS